MLNQTAEVCIANIGPKQRRNRLYVGLAGMAAGLVAAIALSASGAPIWMRALCFVPFLLGALGVWQYQEKT
jgi:hypothetical protein